MPAAKRGKGGKGPAPSGEGSSAAAHYSLQSQALDVVLDNLSLVFPKAELRAKDLARLAAVDKRCRDAVRDAVNKRRLEVPPWVTKPWPKLFCTNTFARLTPACKVGLRAFVHSLNEWRRLLILVINSIQSTPHE
jgi:hypothetical protein